MNYLFIYLLSGARVQQNPADGKEQPPLSGVSSQPAARSARASFGPNIKETIWFIVPGLGPPSRTGFNRASEPDPAVPPGKIPSLSKVFLLHGNIGKPRCFYRIHRIPGKIPARSKVFLLPGNIGIPQCFPCKRWNCGNCVIPLEFHHFRHPPC